MKEKEPGERKRRQKNIAVGLILVFFVVLFYVMSIVRLRGY